MIVGDISVVIVFIAGMFVFSQNATPIWFALIASIALCLPLIFILKWPKRFHASTERSKLLRRKERSLIGAFTEIHPYDTGKEKTVSVLDGYSQKAFSAEIYNHYHFEKQKIYDGTIAIFETCELDNGHYYYTNHKITIRTLPKTFFGTEDELPNIDQVCKLYYVTASDGTNYFVDAEKAH